MAASDEGSSTVPALGALEALYDAYHRQALGVAFRVVGDRQDAEEVVQEAFLAAWRSLSNFDPVRGSTRTWLLSIVRNRAIDVLRSRGRRPSLPLDLEIHDVRDERDPSTDAATAIDARAATAVLAQLPHAQREAVELAFFAGLSHTEIAEQVRAPLGTVKGRIRLGLDRLRIALDIREEQFTLP